ncbi:chondroitin sulfate proteoglycan 5-like isoform X1 [Scyliorhinus canicula]|uniref:chondroitin sulfate proteoglycan 5-like isoform X1 n=1 Tax=Scyliorhinus canicula TaxID=7830 RepID=UPI0018F44F36|nr:chondroitin sulfate proteoglycan 5-like isoform X1 [Scyliorhinus canicula]
MGKSIECEFHCSLGWKLLLLAWPLCSHQFMAAAVPGSDDTVSAHPTEDTTSAVLNIDNSSSLTHSYAPDPQTVPRLKASLNVSTTPSHSPWPTPGESTHAVADALGKNSMEEQPQSEGLDDGTGSGQLGWEQGVNGSHSGSEEVGGLGVTSSPLTNDLDQEPGSCLGCQGAEQELEEEPPSPAAGQITVPGLDKMKGVEGIGETFGPTRGTAAFKENQDTKLDLFEEATNLTTQGAEGSTDYTRLDLEMQLWSQVGTIPALQPLTPSEPSEVPTDYIYSPENNTTSGSYDRFPVIEASDVPITPSNLGVTEDDLPDLPALTLGPDVSVSDVQMATYYWDEIATDVEDENELRLTTVSPKIQTMLVKEEGMSMQTVPNQDFRSESFLKKNAFTGSSGSESRRDTSLSPPVLGGNGSDCKLGYHKQNKSCKSVCDMVPNYCYNGGQCYIMENVGAICRCNAQDYIWHKGMRCEFIITEFQVMCIAVGSSAVVILLLFMLTVFFAKKMYSLKTENKKLRKRSTSYWIGSGNEQSQFHSKYRPQLEQHNDNFSLSTIAEGSQANDDANGQNKIQDSLKTCPKDGDSLNVQNNWTPKHDNKDGASAEVNSLQNNMM